MVYVKEIKQHQSVAVLVVIAFTTSLLVGLLNAPEGLSQSAPAANTIVAVAKDYETAVTSVFGTSAVIYLKAHKDGASDLLRDYLNLVVTNAAFTGTTDKISIHAAETDVNSDIYLASFQVSTSAFDDTSCTQAGYGKILGNCKVKVNGASRTQNILTITAGGVSTDTVLWVPSITGSLSAVQTKGTGTTINGYSDPVTVTVTDADLNTATTQESYPSGTTTTLRVRATSDSDSTGEVVTIVESGTGSATFTGTFGFEEVKFPNNGLLFARGGDRVFVKYFEETDGNGNPQTYPSEFTFSATSDGGVFLDSGSYFGCTTTGSSPCSATTSTGAVGQIVVSDLDRSSPTAATAGDANEITVRVGSETSALTIAATCSSSTGGLAVTLTEIGGRSGVFAGTFGFAASTAGTSLGVSHGDLITVLYCDPGDRGGISREHTATARWYAVQTGSATIGDAVVVGTVTTFRLIGTSPATFTLTDQDLDQNKLVQETVSVKVKSSSDPATGVTVTLSESGLSSSAFTGTVGFTTGSTTSSALQVKDGDNVSVDYADLHDATGKALRVVSAPAVWRPAKTAEILTSAPEYFKTVCTATGCAADLLDDIDVVVIDPDRNHPSVQDSITLVASSTAQAAGLFTQLSLPLNEVGIDSGIFVGTVELRLAPRTDAMSAWVQAETDGDIISLVFTDPVNSNEDSGEVTKTVTFHDCDPGGTGANPDCTTHNPRFARFEGQKDPIGVPPRPTNVFVQTNLYISTKIDDTTTLKVAYYGDDVNADGDALTTVGVKSTTCDDFKDMTLGDDGDLSTPGRRSATITFRTIVDSSKCPVAANEATQIGVRVGDLVTINVDGTNVVQANSLKILAKTPGYVEWLAPNRTARMYQQSGVGLPANLLIVDPESNKNGLGRESVSVTVASTEGADSEVLTAVETLPDSGIFTTSVGFTTGTGASGQVKVKNLFVGEVTGAPTNRRIREILTTTYAGANTEAQNTTAKLFLFGPASAGQDATLTVAQDVAATETTLYGSSGQYQKARVEVTDDGGGGPLVRVVDNVPTRGANNKDFTLTDGGMVAKTAGNPGSELVYVTQSMTKALSAGATTTSPLTVDAQAAAAEGITDSNRDGRVNCLDIIITGQTATGPALVTCRKVNSPGAGQVDFETNCPQEACASITIKYEYRALLNNVDSPAAFQYKRDGATKIKFGVAVPTSETVKVSYLKNTRSAILTAPNPAGGVDQDKITLTYVDTADKWRGTFEVETTPVANNGKIKVTSPSTLVTVHFPDPSKATGEAVPLTSTGSFSTEDFRTARGTILWKATGTAIPSFRSSDYASALTGTVSGPFVSVQFVDIDSDTSDRRESISITAKDTASGGDSVPVALRETDAHSGVFRGVVRVNDDTSSTDANGVDFASGGGTLSIAYVDPRDAPGEKDRSQALSIGWKPSGDGVIALFKNGFTTPADLTAVIQGTEGALFVQVTDSDANTQSSLRNFLNVRVSTDRPGSEKTFELRETTATSGIFRSDLGIKFEPVASGGSRVFAHDGDTVYVRYDDPIGTLGTVVTIVPPVVAGVVQDTKWDQTFDGAIRFERPYFIGLNSQTTTGLLNHGHVILPDGDRNIDVSGVPAASVVNSVIATAFTFASRDSTNAVLTSDRALTLWETGANSGVFVGNVSFASGSGSDESAGADAEIKVADEGRLILTYADTTDVTGTIAKTFTGEANWYQADRGVLKLGRTVYTNLNTPVAISLYDFSADPTTTTIPTTRTVTVQSQTNTAGISVTLSGTTAGVYAGSITLTDAASTSALQVAERDNISVVYTDTNPAGTRSDRSLVIIGDEEDPVTTLTLSPVTPDGENGWYVAAPTVTLTASEAVQSINYKIDNGALQLYNTPSGTGAFVVGDHGEHNITYYSTDLSGNVETAKVQAVKLDLVSPVQVVTQVNASAIAGGKARVTWPANSPKPSDFQRFEVYRVSSSVPAGVRVGNATTNTTFEDLPPADGGFQYHIRIVDQAGRKGDPSPVSLAVSTDRFAPTVTEPLVTPGTFDIRDAIPVVQFSVRATDSNLDKVLVELTVGGVSVASLNATLGASGKYEATFQNFTLAGVYNVTFRALDRVGNAATRSATLTVFGPDALAPTVTVTPASGSEVAEGTAIQIRVEDNFGLSSVAYSLDGGAKVAAVIPSVDTRLVDLSVQTAGLALGAHTIVIEAVDKPDRATTRNTTVTYSFSLTASPLPLPEVLFVPEVTAKSQRDGTIKVTWKPPTTTGPKVLGGYLVWRASSPFEQVGLVQAPKTQFVDNNTTIGQSYRYAVSWFATDGFGNVTNISLVRGFDKVDPATLGSQPVTAKEGGLTTLQWFLLVGLPLLLVAIGIAVYLVMRGAPRRGPVPAKAKPAQVVVGRTKPAAPEQRHVLRCPQCQHRFEVYGRKPIVTNCPNCGRKGILR